YTLEDIKGKDIDDCIIPRSRKKEGRSLSRRTWVGEVVVAESVRKKADGGEIPVSILGAPIMIGDKRVGMFAIYRDITERKQAQEQLENSFVDLAETVSRAMESRDPYTSGHQRRVAELACLVGKKMGLDKNRLQGLHIGGLLHDIGKISTPESILSKPGELADEEWSLIYAHTKQGYLILKGTNLPWPVADMALHHHERLDGSGYPHGISGDKLSLEVRILGVCDVVEAMSSHRPYRPARSMAEILKELRSGRGTKYDANVVDVMLEIIENGEFEVGGEVSRQL
ncbi:MAG: HD domain-containing protein, partial [Dehalococcoidia bacterium]|nr:HD domain-containing protein [Dehalococcoidia bacterium]